MVQPRPASLGTEAGLRRLELALARAPVQLDGACRRFRELTGLTAVIHLGRSTRTAGDTPTILPPVHPLCAERTRATPEPPCQEQWQAYLRDGFGSRQVNSHSCELGLYCAWVPVHLGNRLIGLAKVAIGSDRSPVELSSAAATLALLVSASCQEALFAGLSNELRILRGQLDRARSLRRESAAASSSRIAHRSIVRRALDFLQEHFADPDLRLESVAAALECNGDYLTRRFTQVVGRHMRSYIVALRVDRACRQLLGTDRPIKQIAYESGFRVAGDFSRVFRRQVGVSPSEYRRLFAGDVTF